MMNDHCDTEWFGREGVFGKLDGQEWHPYSGRIEFPKGKTWKAYVDSRRLEITCGEAPYIVSRYDMGTGEPIPIERRIGILDRKLRVVNENTETEEEWLKWAKRAFQSVYGYEYQGDNLLVARINLLLTFTEYLEDRWKRKATDAELDEIAKIISWNIWQMDGLKGTIPLGALYEAYKQLSLFDLFDFGDKQDEPEEKPPCRVFDWRGQKKSIEFNAFKEGRQGSMKFDFIIGNPPYQEETESESTRMPPIYNKFMEETYRIADKVELITPARFLFNAGYTPTDWNLKMLNDEHFKVLKYEVVSGNIFPNTDIKGGIAVHYHDNGKHFGAIGTFTVFDELNTILQKVRSKGFSSLSEVVSPALSYKLSRLMLEENPNSLDRLRTSCFTTLAEIFFEEKPNDGHDYIRMIGILGNKRTYRYVRRDYIVDSSNKLDYYKIIVPASNGSGAIGEVLSTPLLGEPLLGHTQSFISIGRFATKAEAANAMKYVKSKFARTMLGILKVTQHNPPEKWQYVPLQDFTSASDIDWSQPVAGIDQQLYRKYGLSDEEIAFIESHVKEMA